jgi:hypothetical protein
MDRKKGRKDHVALRETFEGGAAGGFIAQLSSTDLGASPPRVVIDERWKVIVYRTHARRGTPPYHLFDLEWRDTVLGSSPLKLPQYRYGGLKSGPFALEPGKPCVSRYRFVVADGPADPALLERLFQDYTRPPKATLELSL